MNVVPFPVAQVRKPRTEVRSSEMSTILDEYPSIQVLSLDCFDTLLFRGTATPVDVFYDLAQREPFQRRGYNAKLRASAEANARQFKRLRQGISEVNLVEVHRAAFPDLTDAEVEALIEAEVEAEIATCYAFPATCELIRRAKARGLEVVIVSDTYLREPELRRLLAATLPADVYASIDRVFVSSAYGRSKGEGLFRDVLQSRRWTAERVLHVGDNAHADYWAPSQLNMKSLRFVQHDDAIEELLRLQGTAGSLVQPGVRHQGSLPSPYRALLTARTGETDPQWLLGYAALGPILYGFARFVLDELAALEQAGKTVKVAFLMRDAYLVMQVCEAIADQRVGAPVAISRFAAYAASFRTARDVEEYLARFVGSERYGDLARQLLLPERKIQEIVARAKQAKRPIEEFSKQILRSSNLETIFSRSKEYRARLYGYLRKTLDLSKGETLMFVDLGYEGTAQKRLEPIFRDELDVEVVGRYMLAARTFGYERSHKGLIDPAWCEDRVVDTVVPYIALVEDLCTADDGSVVDYDAEGSPVFAARVLHDEQYARVKPIQAHCLQFARDAEALFSLTRRPSLESMRVTALAALARLLFFPTRHEIGCLEGFRLDMNLATNDSFRLFDREEGLAGLRRRGLFFMEKNLKSLRMNYPTELRSAGLELSISMFAQHRYGLSFTKNDLTLRKEPLQVLALRGADATTATVAASATHDGFFALTIPVGHTGMSVGVMFGERYQWLQIEAVERIYTDAYLRDDESHHTRDIFREVVFEGMTERASKLFECHGPSAFMLVPGGNERAVVRVTFRPITLREKG